MMDNPICCPPRVDRFLAVAEIEPWGMEKPGKTVKQIREQDHRMVACLKKNKRMKLDI